MRPGPDIIILCPRWKSLHRQRTLRAGNTFGAKFWTDGKMEAPMLPEMSKTTKCRKCGSIFWVKDAERIGGIFLFVEARGNTKIPSEWKDCPRISGLDKIGLVEALKMKIAPTPEEEKYLRVRLWWAINDEARKGSHHMSDGDKVVFRENLEKLIALLLDSVPEERILKAEAYRELGVFDQVLPLLKGLPEKFQRIAEKIKNLTEENIVSVSKY